MKSFSIILFSLLSSLVASAAPVSIPRAASITPAGISAQIASITDQTTVTVPANALAAFKTLAAGGKLSAAESTAISDCVSAARTNNTASKADLKSEAGNIVFDANKIALHACEGATGGQSALDLLVSNVGNINIRLGRLNGAAPPKVTVLS